MDPKGKRRTLTVNHGDLYSRSCVLNRGNVFFRCAGYPDMQTGQLARLSSQTCPEPLGTVNHAHAAIRMPPLARRGWRVAPCAKQLARSGSLRVRRLRLARADSYGAALMWQLPCDSCHFSTHQHPRHAT
eukprot:1181119-Prorocentrum_minimum.AAC.1